MTGIVGLHRGPDVYSLLGEPDDREEEEEEGEDADI